MTKDTYLRTVSDVLAQDQNIRIHDSHQSKLAALGRSVERGDVSARDTIATIEEIFSPWIGRELRSALERALR